MVNVVDIDGSRVRLLLEIAKFQRHGSKLGNRKSFTGSKISRKTAENLSEILGSRIHCQQNTLTPQKRIY